jgi:hypothetical protein
MEAHAHSHGTLANGVCDLGNVKVCAKAQRQQVLLLGAQLGDGVA